MHATLRELAELVGGRIVGQEDLQITGTATLACARPGQITLCDHERYAAPLSRSQASAAVVGPDFQPGGWNLIVVEKVHVAFAKIVTHFRPEKIRPRRGIHPSANIAPSAKLGTNVEIQAGVTIGEDVVIGDGTTIHPGVCIGPDCRIGRNCTLFSNVVLYDSTIVHDRVILHSGAVVGAYGFGYSTSGGRHQLSAQLGYVELECDVEIGACSTVDRGTYGPTLIGEGTKIDNQVQIAHNCRIGRHNLICSQVGIAGSTSTGDYVVLAGQVGIRDHVHIGDKAILGAKSGVMCDIPAGSAQVGIPATPQRDQMMIQAAIGRLPEMRKQFKDLVARVAELEQAIPVALKVEHGPESKNEAA